MRVSRLANQNSVAAMVRRLATATEQIDYILRDLKRRT